MRSRSCRRTSTRCWPISIARGATCRPSAIRWRRCLNERRELIASVSHELRTPVSTARGYLETTLAQADVPEKLQHDLEIVDREIARLQTLIDDLFTLSRAEVGQLALHCQPIDLRPLIGRVIETTAPLAWQSGRVQVSAEVPADLPPVSIDAGRFEQVLRNLLHNAVRHTPPGGIVVTIGRAEADAVVIEVRDTGEGIAPEDLPHVWERFYRAGENGGVGLGLAIVKELSRSHGRIGQCGKPVGRGELFCGEAARGGLSSWSRVDDNPVQEHDMFELPEVLNLVKQMNETLVSKTIGVGHLGNSPHKFVWYNREPR